MPTWIGQLLLRKKTTLSHKGSCCTITATVIRFRYFHTLTKRQHILSSAEWYATHSKASMLYVMARTVARSPSHRQVIHHQREKLVPVPLWERSPDDKSPVSANQLIGYWGRPATSSIELRLDLDNSSSTDSWISRVLCFLY